MPQISGVNITSTTLIDGINATSVSAIDGILTSNIPGWPSAGPTCTLVRLGFADGRKSPPPVACTNQPGGFLYDFDATNNLLYSSNSCGISFSGPGYYSDGILIYYWDGSSSWTVFGPCPR